MRRPCVRLASFHVRIVVARSWQDPQVTPGVQVEGVDAVLHPLLPIRDGLAIVLRLLRASGRPEELMALRGAFQQTMGGRTAQMIRIRVDSTAMCVPETSANKYALNVRFMHAETVTRPGQVEVDVSFELTFCNL